VQKVSKVYTRIVEKFGDEYDYSKTEYKGANVKVTIGCRKHGEFSVWPYNYINGAGCPRCSLERNHDSVRATTEDFIRKSKAKHGDTYDYSKSEYTGKKEKITVICREHGEFYPVASNHYINGAGCPKCGIEKAHARFRKTNEKFIEDSKKIHGDKLDYSKVDYKSNKKFVTLTCPTHGDFESRPDCHLFKGYGCPKCSMAGTSKAEQDMFAYVQSLVGDEAINRYRPEPGLEADIAVPSRNIAFEFNGLFWHSEQMGKGPMYHLKKTETFAQMGIRLIHIFEDEWRLYEDKVKSKIKHLLGLNGDRVYARETEARQITPEQARAFFSANHIQGGGITGFFNAGLFTKDNVLIAAMNFGNDRYSKAKRTVELLRYASSRHVVGGASKLLKFFIKNRPENIDSIISYSDRRWSEGNLYKQLGFAFVGNSYPSYFYVKPSECVRINRQRYQKHMLPKLLETFDPKKTEVQNCVANGMVRIFDCGTNKWQLNIV